MQKAAHAPFPEDFDKWVEHFDEFSGFYNEALDGSAGLRYLARTELEAVHTLVRHEQTGSVLDLGSGTGRISAAFTEWGYDVTSTDASESMLEILGERFGKEPVQAKMGEALPFDDASFDVVVSIRVLKYVKNWEFALSEMRRVCRPGGVVVIEWTNRRSAARFGYSSAPVTLVTQDEVDAVLGTRYGAVSGSRTPHVVWRSAKNETAARMLGVAERGAQAVAQLLRSEDALARSVISAHRV
jgi:ubiquinone/menaquinone biosynthesis C-methylase UbiE